MDYLCICIEWTVVDALGNEYRACQYWGTTESLGDIAIPNWSCG